jgi:phage terminase large subunit-like protein
MPRLFDTEQIFKEAHPDLINLGIHIAQDDLRYDYEELMYNLKHLEKTAPKKYISLIRQMARDDFFFFCYYVLDLPIGHPYLLARCYEAQDNEEEAYVYIAAGRDHWKSVLNTICFPLWQTIKDPDQTHCILSFQRDKALGQLMSIKQICETNPLLFKAWPEIFYAKKQLASKWNIYQGLYLKRNSTVKEATFSAWGFIDNSPISMHFDWIYVDDPVTLDNTATLEQMEKVKAGYKMLAGIGTRRLRLRTITTRYDVNDISADIIKDERYKKIIIGAEVNAEGIAAYDSIPVYKTRAELDNIRMDFGDAYYAGQMLQDPTAASDRGFKREWLGFYQTAPENITRYILCDPANAKNKKSDYTVYAVIGADSQRQFYLLDMVRDKLDVYERFDVLSELVRKYAPDNIFYEQQGLNSDLEVFDREMERTKYYFPIQKISSNVQNSKFKRINLLASEFRKKNFLLPEELYYIDIEGNERNLIEEFIEEEYSKFPHNKAHDDMLDAMAWIQNIEIDFPDPANDQPTDRKVNTNFRIAVGALSTNDKKDSWVTSYAW